MLVFCGANLYAIMDGYLGVSASLTDAAQSSMDKQFVYEPIPAEKSADLAVSLEKKDGVMEIADLRAHALAIDADLIIYGFFKTTPGKKGDTADISVTVFRADKGAAIGNLNRKALVSGAIFKDIDVMAADVVRQIAEYRKSQNAAAGKKEPGEASGEKIHLTRDSLNMLPFIPPVF